MTEAPSVIATFNYTAPMDAEPEIYFYEPDDGRVKHDPVADPRPMRVRDVRGQDSAFTLDADGLRVAFRHSGGRVTQNRGAGYGAGHVDRAVS